MYKNKHLGKSSSQIDLFTSDDNDIEIVVKKGRHADNVISLSDMKLRKKEDTSIYELNILGGIDYLELEKMFVCLDKQIEYMENLGLQIKIWRLEYIYRIEDGYVCLDVENIEKYTQRDDRAFKKELVNLIEMDKDFSKIVGTRLYREYNQ